MSTEERGQSLPFPSLLTPPPLSRLILAAAWPQPASLQGSAFQRRVWPLPCWISLHCQPLSPIWASPTRAAALPLSAFSGSVPNTYLSSMCLSEFLIKMLDCTDSRIDLVVPHLLPTSRLNPTPWAQPSDLKFLPILLSSSAGCNIPIWTEEYWESVESLKANTVTVDHALVPLCSVCGVAFIKFYYSGNSSLPWGESPN